MPDILGYENQKHDVIMFNMGTMHDWDHGIVNRNRQIMETLTHEEQINRIIAVDFFPIGVKKAIKHYWQNLLMEIKDKELIYGDLTSACYQKTAKIYTYTSIDSLFSWKIVARELRRIEKALNLKNIIFWSYNPLFTEFIGKLREELFVFDTVDNWLEHPGYLKLMKAKKLKQNYQLIADRADCIFTVSEELLDFYKSMNRDNNVHWIPNGVSYEHFNDPAWKNNPNELTQINEPIIGYIGTIEHRVDLDLIKFLAEQNPDKKIILCGPVWKPVEHEVKAKLESLPNVKLLGRISYNDTPSYLNKFDVAIIPHKTNNFIASTNPMKLYEYLACGKPVVSTRGAGVSMFSDHIGITNDYTEFNQLLNDELAQDSAEKQQARRNAVQSHSWHSRVDKMLEIVFKTLEKKAS